MRTALRIPFCEPWLVHLEVDATVVCWSTVRWTLLAAAPGRGTATAAAADRGAHRARADVLHGFEVDERLPVVEDGAQLVVSSVREIALRLHDLIVGRHADVHLALRRFEALLRELARRRRRLHAL